MSKCEILPDIVCDTNIVSHIIIQYYTNYKSVGRFIASELISNKLAIKINKAIENEAKIFLIIASTFAFVELARKFDAIFNNKITYDQFRAFIDQPPEWFYIQDLDSSLFIELLKLPAFVTLDNKNVPIEWADALHAATAITREAYLFATSDTRLKNIEILKKHLI